MYQGIWSGSERLPVDDRSNGLLGRWQVGENALFLCVRQILLMIYVFGSSHVGMMLMLCWYICNAGIFSEAN